MSENKTQKLWVVVKHDKIDSADSLEKAISKFSSFAEYVASDSKLLTLTYNPNGKSDSTTIPMWKIEGIEYRDLAKKFLEVKPNGN